MHSVPKSVGAGTFLTSRLRLWHSTLPSSRERHRGVSRGQRQRQEAGTPGRKDDLSGFLGVWKGSFPARPRQAHRPQSHGGKSRPVRGARGRSSPDGHEMAPGIWQRPPLPGAAPGMSGRGGETAPHPPISHCRGALVKDSDPPFCKISPQTTMISLLAFALLRLSFALLRLYPNRCSWGRGSSGGHGVNSYGEREPCLSPLSGAAVMLAFNPGVTSGKIPKSLNVKDTGGVCVCL